MRQIWIPHLTKMSVAQAKEFGIFGTDAFDPADPPLAPGQKDAATQLVQELFLRFGPPAVIFHSPKIRCQQTARPAIERFVKPRDERAPLAFALSCLAQTESGEHDPENPEAEADGLVYYGERSGPGDWVSWFNRSRTIIRSVSGLVHVREHESVWVFTHRPIVAASRWATLYGKLKGEDVVWALEHLDPLDKTLLPYCVFDDWDGDGRVPWFEVPRT